MRNTELILEELTESLVVGMPRAVVICQNLPHLKYMFGKVCQLQGFFQNIKMSFSTCFSEAFCVVVVENSVVEFITWKEIDEFRKYKQGYGEFWDAYAEEEYNQDRLQKGQVGPDSSVETNDLGISM